MEDLTLPALNVDAFFGYMIPKILIKEATHMTHWKGLIKYIAAFVFIFLCLLNIPKLSIAETIIYGAHNRRNPMQFYLFVKFISIYQDSINNEFTILNVGPGSLLQGRRTCLMSQKPLIYP